MNKRFQEKYAVNEKLLPEKIEKIYGKNFNPLLANLLFVRGVDSAEKAEEFLNPK